MNYSATITSKRQLTIPAEVFRKLNLKEGEKVSITLNDQDKSIKIQSRLAHLEKMAGSVKISEHLKGMDIDKAIRIGKERYFRKRYLKKLKQ